MAEQNTPVLVTGGTGYLAAHVIVRLLREGYPVRTTVRSLDRRAEVRAAVEQGGADPAGLEFVAADLGADGGWAEAVAGCEYVQHVASPFPAAPPEHDEDVIGPARDGALRVLRAARDAGVRRVVLTSSFAAVGYSRKPGGEYDETDWTDPADDNSAYIRSKAIAERAAWDFVRETGAPELVVINPTGIFGPALGPRLSTSPGHIKAMLDGAMPAAPPMHFGIVDVRDVAEIHVRAMTEPEAAGERFLATADVVSFLDIARILAARLGERAARVPDRELTPEEVREAAEANPALADVARQLGRIPVISTEKARKVLGWHPRDVATTIADTAVSLGF